MLHACLPESMIPSENDETSFLASKRQAMILYSTAEDLSGCNYSQIE